MLYDFAGVGGLITLISEKRLTIDLDVDMSFMGEIIDRCNGDKVLKTGEWKSAFKATLGPDDLPKK
jgi:hypothetical protein